MARRAQAAIPEPSGADWPGASMRLLWLIYVLFVFLPPLIGRGALLDWALAAASVAIFLPLYFGYWAALQLRPGLAFAYVVAIAVLGFAWIPMNVGATTYVVYSAALAPFATRPRTAVAHLAALIILVVLVAFALPALTRYWMAIPTTLLVAMIGGANLAYAEHARRNARVWRAQEEVEEVAALAERERISRDLHDLLGHTLSVIALKSELASKLAASDPRRAIAEIKDVERVSRDALTEVRAAVEGFRAHGFAGELRKAGSALESAGVRLQTDIAPVSMSARQESVMALALREAVTNVVRHARASSCHVSLQEDRGRLLLTVRDDGVGGTGAEGHGLRGMRERVAALGGTVVATREKGTVLTVALPGVNADAGARS